MIASRVRSLILVVALFCVGLAAMTGVSSSVQPRPAEPASRPAAPPAAAPFAQWRQTLPASEQLPDRLALPAELLTGVREAFRSSLADRRERYAALALDPATGRVKLAGAFVGGYDSIERIAARHERPLSGGRVDLGDFHTHPALADDPRHIHGFSPEDINASLMLAASKGLRVFLLADAGRVWMMVRTQTTMLAWPAVQEYLEEPNLAGFLSAADAKAQALAIPAGEREQWVSFHCGLSFNIHVARIRRVLPIYFDPAGRRHENVFLGGYALYVGELDDGVLERRDQ